MYKITCVYLFAATILQCRRHLKKENVRLNLTDFITKHYSSSELELSVSSDFVEFNKKKGLFEIFRETINKERVNLKHTCINLMKG